MHGFVSFLAAYKTNRSTRPFHNHPWRVRLVPCFIFLSLSLPTGEVPDIQIKLKDLLDPLQVTECALMS